MSIKNLQPVNTTGVTHLHEHPYTLLGIHPGEDAGKHRGVPLHIHPRRMIILEFILILIEKSIFLAVLLSKIHRQRYGQNQN